MPRGKKVEKVSWPKALQSYMERIGGEQLNFKRIIVKEEVGDYYREVGIVRIDPDGSLFSNRPELEPTVEEQAAIKAVFSDGGYKFPNSIPTTKAQMPNLQKLVAKDSILYPVYNRATPKTPILMVQERRKQKDGSKAYVPWTFFSDGEWRAMEPDGALPFYKPEKKLHNKIMVHEGAKSAKAAQELKPDHPWYEEMSQYDHWGVLGGALAVHRSDYTELFKENPTELAYMCDNDVPGQIALQTFSRNYGKKMYGIRFTNDFPQAWDIADPMPEKMFAPNGVYKGEPLFNYMWPATFATEEVQDDKGRKFYILRHEFINEWLHSIKPEFFVHKQFPHRLYSSDEFNSKVHPFSHIRDVARLLTAQVATKVLGIEYMPNRDPGVFNNGNGSVINIYRPGMIDPCDGDPATFLDFMEHLIPDAGDREHLLRWCATLIARPDVRMHWSVLLISETQGIGKTTLGESILMPLVGPWNCSSPNEKQIAESSFNSWVAYKRLAIVNEIYSGHSSKAYNNLKTILTDKVITVNRKYVEEHDVSNWIHMLACSNSFKALRVRSDDRRWLVPGVTEKRKPVAYWKKFHNWLNNENGLGIIHKWAIDYLKKNEPVIPGEHAPGSEAKNELVFEGMSPGQARIRAMFETAMDKLEGKDWFFLDCQVAEWAKETRESQAEYAEPSAGVRNVAKAMGMDVGPKNNGCAEWKLTKSSGRVLSFNEKIANTNPAQLFRKGLTPCNPRDFAKF